MRIVLNIKDDSKAVKFVDFLKELSFIEIEKKENNIKKIAFGIQ